MKRYFAEFNRGRGDDIRRVRAKLRKLGMEVYLLPHPTALEIHRPESMSWKDFKRAIRGQIQPRRGSAMILSETTGNTFICSFAGNHAGDFEKL